MREYVAVRVGHYDGDVKALLSEYSPDFQPTNGADPDMPMFELPMLSGYRVLVQSSPEMQNGDNLIFAVRGASVLWATNIMNGLDSKLSIELKKAPPDALAMFDEIVA